MSENSQWVILLLIAGFIFGTVCGLVFVIGTKVTTESSCIEKVKDSYDIIDFNKNELESKIAACNLLYTAGN